MIIHQSTLDMKTLSFLREHQRRADASVQTWKIGNQSDGRFVFGLVHRNTMHFSLLKMHILSAVLVFLIVEFLPFQETECVIDLRTKSVICCTIEKTLPNDAHHHT